MSDFLNEKNVAGQTLLRLVARGSAILTEMLRLSGHIPAVFLEPGSPGASNSYSGALIRARFEGVVFDFQYFKKTDLFEHRISNSLELMELDDEFRQNHIDILNRFFQLFDSVFRFVSDFLHYLDGIANGAFVQYTIDVSALPNRL